MDYYTPPDSHPNQADIDSLADKLDELIDEYNQLESGEYTEAGETRCNVLEEEIESLQREIKSLYEGD